MAEEHERPEHAILLPNGGWDTRIYAFRAGSEVDTYAIVTRRFVVVVDTMSTPQMATEIMGALQRVRHGRQLLVINTHADYDHCWGNRVFIDPDSRFFAPIIGHQLARERLQSDEERAKLVARQASDPRFSRVELIPPTIAFTDHLVIDGGDLALHLIPTPGHTEDHIVVWLPLIRTLLAGDAAEQPFPWVHRGAQIPPLRASLEHMLALDPVVVLPCHTSDATSPDLLRRNLAYFAEAERHCRALMLAGGVPEDWATREDLPDALGFPFDDAVTQLGEDPAKFSPMYRTVHHDALRAMLEWLAG